MAMMLKQKQGGMKLRCLTKFMGTERLGGRRLRYVNIVAQTKWPVDR